MKKLVEKNNRGAALISILIAVTFVSIIATSLLYISASNYRMKVANNESKKNFYQTEGNMMKVTQKLRTSFTVAADPMSIVQTYQAKDKDHYDCKKLANILVKDEAGNSVANVSSSDASSATVSFNSKSDDGLYEYDVEVHSSNNAIKYYELSGGTWKPFTGTEMNNGTYRIVFEDVQIREQSTADDFQGIDYFENTIKTDIVLDISRSSSSKEIGGIGDFSILMDNQLLVDGSDFTTLNLYGNSMTANYALNSTLKVTTPVNSGGNGAKAALHLQGDNHLNVMGDYFVVFGDVVLEDDSALYLNGTNLMVYGNIYINDKAAVICSEDSKICMVGVTGKDNISGYTPTEISANTLPGYSGLTKIICSDNNPKKHLYPESLFETYYTDEKCTTASDAGLYSKIFKRFNKADSYDIYAKYMRFNDNNASNDGILNNILVDKNDASNHKYDIRKIIPDGSEVTLVDKSKTKYYNEPVGVYARSAAQMNGGISDSLLFVTRSSGEVTMQQSNVNTTIISTCKLNVNMKHTVTLSKVGPDKFNWLTLPYGTTDIRKTNAVHDFKQNGCSTNISIGSFFKDATFGDETLNPNMLVQKLLQCSSDSSDDGVPSVSKTAIYMQNWSKDL